MSKRTAGWLLLGLGGSLLALSCSDDSEPGDVGASASGAGRGGATSMAGSSSSAGRAASGSGGQVGASEGGASGFGGKNAEDGGESPVAPAGGAASDPCIGYDETILGVQGEHRWAAWPMPNAAGSDLPNPQTFDTTDPDVVVDEITGLSWQRTAVAEDETPVVSDAELPLYNELLRPRRYCDMLSLGGFDDWRLPSRIELLSIADIGKRNPAIDPVAFPDTPAMSFWSSSLVCRGGIYFVELYDGGVTTVGGSPYIRCVRGGEPARDPSYTVTAETVSDERTGLVWQRSVSDRMTWANAQTYCSELDAEGGGWRIPTAKELQTLIDESRPAPLVDPTAFPGVPPRFGTSDGTAFWAAESEAFAERVWRVSFTVGTSIMGPPGELELLVRCVR